jgi:hypothetical protein
MRHPSTKTLLRALKLATVLCAVSLVLVSPAAADQLDFSVTINLGNFAGNPGFGYMDRQFNPGSFPGSQFASIGMDQPLGSSAVSQSGDVSESALSQSSTFDNGTPFNDLFDQFFFSPTSPLTSVTLMMGIDGPAVESPDPTSISGSTFAISFFDSNFNPIFTTNPDGFAAIINLNPDGTATVENFPGSDGGSVVITALNPPPPPATPEPNTIILIATGLSGILALARRKARSNGC